MRKLSSWFFGACCSLFCLATALPAFAEGEVASTAPTVTPLIDTDGLQETLIGALQQWILIGVGIGISVMVAFIGWRWIRRFIGR